MRAALDLADSQGKQAWRHLSVGLGEGEPPLSFPHRPLPLHWLSVGLRICCCASLEILARSTSTFMQFLEPGLQSTFTTPPLVAGPANGPIGNAKVGALNKTEADMQQTMEKRDMRISL